MKYYEYQRSDDVMVRDRKRVYLGTFIEQIEYDDNYGYEKLDVPSVLDSRRSVVIHDFEKVCKLGGYAN